MFPVVRSIKIDVMVPSDHNLELCIRGFQPLDVRAVVGSSTDHCKIAGMEEDVGGRERVAEGIFWMGRWGGCSVVGVYDYVSV